MITRFAVLIVAALLPSVTAEDDYTTSGPEKCLDPSNYDLRATNFTADGVTVQWYVDTDCTNTYRICWDSSTDSVSTCHNISAYTSLQSEYSITLPHACMELNIRLDALHNYHSLPETVSSTITVVTAPSQVPVVTLSQPYGKASLNVEWLYGIAEHYCSSGFIVTWCNATVCDSKSVDRWTYSYEIENLQFCEQYNVSVKAEDRANNHISEENVQIVSVDQVRELTVADIRSRSIVLRWAPRGVALCVGGKVCYLRSDVTSEKVPRTCFNDIKSTDTFLTVIGLNPSTYYNFTYESNVADSNIAFQELTLIKTATEVPVEGP